MAAEYLTRRQFLLAQSGASMFSSKNAAEFLSLRFAPVAGSKWSVIDNELRVVRSGQKLACSKPVTDIEYHCSTMMDGTISLDGIIAELSHYLHQDKATIRKIVLEFSCWALANSIIRIDTSGHD